MAKPTPKPASASIPTYRRQKRKGKPDLAFVELNGRRRYLGVYRTPASRQRYDQAIREWMSDGREHRVSDNNITVMELVARFWKHAKVYYRRPDGSQTSSVDNYKLALSVVKKLYGPTVAVEFGPRKLKVVRDQMIDKGWTRGWVNAAVHLVRAAFRWGVSEELIPVEVHTTLLTVTSLRRGRTKAPDKPPVQPVPDSHIKAIRPYVSRQAWALVQLQLCTSARAGELVKLRPVDLDTTGSIWTATPADHKKAHAGRARTIYFGPR